MSTRQAGPSRSLSLSRRRIGWAVVAGTLFLISAAALVVFLQLWAGGDELDDPRSGGLPVDQAEQTPTASPRRQVGHEKMLAALKEFGKQDASFFTSAARSDGGVSGAQGDLAELSRVLETAHEQSLLGNEQSTIDHLLKAYQSLPRLRGTVAAPAATMLAFRLGVAYLRLGESQNCCARHSGESCILPIRGAGLHTERNGSEQAVKYFTLVLKATPKNTPYHLKARWLLNIASMTLGDYPAKVPPAYLIPPSAFGKSEIFPRFENIAPQLSLSTFNMCGGAVIDDFNNDGYLDILTSTWDLQGQMEYFKNLGNGRFIRETQRAGLMGFSGGLNLVHADYNNDGYLDILVLRGAWRGVHGQVPNSLLHNNGDGTFSDVTFEAGLGNVHFPTQTAAWADYDNDGDLDVYVGNEHGHGFQAPCQLFENQGDGTFLDVAQKAGVENLRFTKGVVFGDYDRDRWPDIYVSNLGEPNRLYRNKGDGTFEDIALQLGVDRPICSFPVWFWDYDNDGSLDLYVSSYVWYRYGEVTLGLLAASYLDLMDQLNLPNKVESARLYRGSEQGAFRDVAAQSNLDRLSLPMGANFGDLDNDGYLDFFLGTGYPDYEALMPNVMYHNQQGERFADVTMSGGFGHLQKGHAIAFADIDGDGDQDVYSQMGGAFSGDKFNDALFKNPGMGNHWITVKLVGKQSNRCGIGARLRVDIEEQGRSRTVFRHVNGGGSFGGNPLTQTVGLGKASEIKRLSVYWPTSDTTQVFEEVPLDRSIEITESDDKVRVVR